MDLKNKILCSRYRVDERVGEGGMASVYRGFDMKLSRTIAIKVLKAEYRDNKDFVQRFEVEARAAASLNHINIVGVYDVGEDLGVNFIIMEYLSGMTLKRYITAKGALSNEETLNIAGSIASALITAHKNHIIHRDIKPQNIMITEDDKIKVTDFGIAKVTKESALNTMVRRSKEDTIDANGQISGSIHYMAPEILKRNYSDEKSDIYALGITMYEMITGHVPFDGDSDINIALEHINDPLPDIKRYAPDVLPAIEQIIKTATQKDSSARYHSAEEFLKELKKAINTPDKVFIKIDDKNDIIERTQTKVLNQKASREIRNSNRKAMKEKQRREKKLTLLAALSGVVLALILAYLVITFNKETLFPTKVVMPNLSEMTKEEYEAFFRENDLDWEIKASEYDSKIPEGGVISQSHDEGMVVTKKDKITLLVSKGQKLKKVPNLVNLEYETAISLLESKGFKYEINRVYNDEVMVGLVIAHKPAKMMEVSEGTTIVMDVSLGKEEKFTKMPDVKGKSLDEGVSLLEDAGLLKGEISEAYNDEIEAGKIIAATVLAGEDVKTGYVVDLTISLGKENKAADKSIEVNDILGAEEIVANLRVVLILDGVAEDIYVADVTHASFEPVLSIPVSGRGKGKYEVYKDGVMLYTNAIIFTEDE